MQAITVNTVDDCPVYVWTDSKLMELKCYQCPVLNRTNIQPRVSFSLFFISAHEHCLMCAAAPSFCKMGKMVQYLSSVAFLACPLNLHLILVAVTDGGGVNRLLL